MNRVVVGITGASGMPYAIDLLETLKGKGIETYVVLSEWAGHVLKEETGLQLRDLKRMCTRLYRNGQMAADISSSSFPVDGMVVIPASVKTASEIANAHTGTLIARAADNMLKMRKRLVVCIRETPLSGPCLENLARIAQYGGIVMPLSPGFYHRPKDIKDMYNFITGKVLDCLGIENSKFKRWKG